MKCCKYQTDVIWRYFKAIDLKLHEADIFDKLVPLTS